MSRIIFSNTGSILCGIVMAAGLMFSCTETKKPVTDSTPTEDLIYAKKAVAGGNTVAYFSYINGLNRVDTLAGLSTPVSSSASVHETFEEDGLKGMRPVRDLIIQPGDTLKLQPGGLHVMIMNVSESLSSADSLTLTLKWKQAGDVKLKIPVQ